MSSTLAALNGLEQVDCGCQLAVQRATVFFEGLRSLRGLATPREMVSDTLSLSMVALVEELPTRYCSQSGELK